MNIFVRWSCVFVKRCSIIWPCEPWFVAFVVIVIATIIPTLLILNHSIYRYRYWTCVRSFHLNISSFGWIVLLGDGLMVYNICHTEIVLATHVHTSSFPCNVCIWKIKYGNFEYNGFCTILLLTQYTVCDLFCSNMYWIKFLEWWSE